MLVRSTGTDAMDRRERYFDPTETLKMAIHAAQMRLWTALPAQIISFNAAKMTVSAQPFIHGRVLGVDGTTTVLPIPPLGDIPVYFPSGGGATLTFPIAPGDECLLIFSARCIDFWWQNGAFGPPPEGRMHNLSDAFALVGVFSQPSVLANVSTSAVQLRSADGSTFLSLNPDARTLALTAPGGVTINGVTIDSSGDVAGVKTLQSSGNISSTAGAVNAKTQVTVNGTVLTVP
jgi:hypothetical protein